MARCSPALVCCRWGISGVGERRPTGVRDDTLRASSASPSVLAVSSLELESGLLAQVRLLGPLEACEEVLQQRAVAGLLLGWEGEPALE